MAPALFLMLLISSASASLAHVLWGRRWSQFLIFWLGSAAACLVAYALSLQLPLPWRLIEPAGVPVLESVLLAWGVIFIAARLRI